jgi:hypothetical protein
MIDGVAIRLAPRAHVDRDPGGTMEHIVGLGSWLTGLDATFAFMLALPFAVAGAGLLAVRRESRDGRPERRTAALNRVLRRPAHVR